MHIGIDTLAAHQKKTGIGTYVSSLVNHLLRVDTANTYTLFVSHENASIFEAAPNCTLSYGPRAIDDTRCAWHGSTLYCR